MAYTKRGPFVDGGAPYLSADFFNSLEGALGGATVNGITGWFHVDQYGAVGDGTTIDRAAIQAAITAANAAYTATGAMQRVYLPGKTYLVDAVNYLKADGTVFGAVGIMLLDGVELCGPGTIKVKNNAYGANALYSPIRSTSTGLTNAAIRGLTIDGNSANQTASNQCSNISIIGTANVVIEGTKQYNANGNGIIIRSSGQTVTMTDVAIRDNYVSNSASIGIQASWFDGLVISGNIVDTCTDNGIDVYGENGTGTVNGVNFVIADNVIKNASTGIFPETVAQGTVTGNMISGCTSVGVHVNRINGQPHDIIVGLNTITGAPTAVMVTGDTGGVAIRGNLCNGFTTAGVQLASGSGNCSNVTVDGNTLNPANASGTTPLVLFAGNQVASCRVRGTLTTATNRGYDVRSTTGTNYQNTIEPSYPPETIVTSLGVASGAPFTFAVSPMSGGTLTIHGTAGGAWSSIWHGVWVSDASRVDITSMGTDFTTPSQLITSVTGSTSTLTVTVATAASGSAAIFDYTIRRITA